MNTFFTITAVLTIMQDVNVDRYVVEDQHCDPFMRILAQEMPDADLTCIAKSPRPIARPDGLGSLDMAGGVE